MDVTDDELMQRLTDGDRQASAMLMQRHLPKILAMSQRLCGSRTEAEDVAQDVFVRLWKTAEKWEPGRAKLSTWIHRVTLNLCYDRLRKHRETTLPELPERVDESAQPAEALLAQQRKSAIDDALQMLPERQRAAIVLCHYQELGNKEAAQIMDVSVEALESLLSRGRRALRDALMQQKDSLLGSM